MWGQVFFFFLQQGNFFSKVPRYLLLSRHAKNVVMDGFTKCFKNWFCSLSIEKLDRLVTNNIQGVPLPTDHTAGLAPEGATCCYFVVLD